MPLRAVSPTGPIVASELSDECWESLRAGVRDGHIKLTLPCCGEAGLTRVSKLGTRHFYHKPKSNCPRKESSEHLLLKDLVYRGAKDAGWEVQVEAIGDGWRADVLAENGKSKVAIEVQLSAQTYDETKARQRKYSEANVRCAWLFKRMPKAAMTTFEIPMFKVDLTDKNRPLVDELPTSRFAHALLSGHYQFRTHAEAASEQCFTLCIYPYKCWKCQTDCHAFEVSNLEMGLLSRHGDAIAHLGDGFQDSVNCCPEAVELVNELRQSDDSLKIGTIKKRFSRTAEFSYLSQGCPVCDAIFGDHYLGTAFFYETAIHTREFNAKLQKNVSVEKPHWCYSARQKFCEGLEDKPN